MTVNTSTSCEPVLQLLPVFLSILDANGSCKLVAGQYILLCLELYVVPGTEDYSRL